MPCMETLLSTNIKTNLFLQILMNAAEKNRLVEKWQCVKIPWDHTSVFARKVLPLMTNKKSVMVSVIHWFIKKRCGENSTNNYNRPFYSCLLSDRLRKTARLEVTKLQLEFGGQFTLSNPLPSSTTVSLESYHLKRL